MKLNFLKKRKADLENLIKILLWIVFFVILSLAVYYLLRHLMSM